MPFSLSKMSYLRPIHSPPITTMKAHHVIILFCAISLFACQQPESPQQEEAQPTRVYHEPKQVDPSDYLIAISTDSLREMGSPCGYVNLRGDTIIPIGKYPICWTDTIKNMGVVYEKTDSSAGYIAIDPELNVLYEVYYYDNGPDWLEDGLFRIMRNGKIGYADEDGFIKIKPQFACANQFDEGRAKVALHCELIPEGEHTRQESDEWFFIDKNGERIE